MPEDTFTAQTLTDLVNEINRVAFASEDSPAVEEIRALLRSAADAVSQARALQQDIDTDRATIWATLQ